MTKKVLICIPTYNEKENILSLVKDILSYQGGAHILVIDDSSPDGTSNIVSQSSLFGKNLFLLKRPGKEGIGKAYLDGFKWALEREYDYIFQCDADFSHNPKYIPEFLEKLNEGFELVIGSRNIEGGGVENWSYFRQILSRFGSFYGRFILGLKIQDLTGGFNAYKKESLEALNLNAVGSNGYVFQIELKYRAYLRGLKVVEIPIIFADRIYGKSKMTSKIVLEAFWHVIYLKLFCRK